MSRMERIKVQSSNLESVGYDLINKILEIGFYDGAVYHYFDVPPKVYKGLMEAGSKGTYHHRFIRKGFRYSQVTVI